MKMKHWKKKKHLGVDRFSQENREKEFFKREKRTKNALRFYNLLLITFINFPNLKSRARTKNNKISLDKNKGERKKKTIEKDESEIVFNDMIPTK